MSVVETKISGNLGVIFLNNPPMNALSLEVFEALKKQFRELELNKDVKAVVVTANGLVFCAGADVKMIYDLAKKGDAEEIKSLLLRLQNFCGQIDSCQKPVIAAVNGICFGGGLELALSCDYIITSPNAQFSFPEINLGIIPGMGGTQRLSRRIGAEEALGMILGAKKLSVSQAQDINLVDEIIQSDFIAGIREFAVRVLNNWPRKQTGWKIDKFTGEALLFDKLLDMAKGKPEFAVRMAQRAVYEGFLCGVLENALAVEQKYFLQCILSSDGLEGVTAFLEKRAPRFSSVIGQGILPKAEQKAEAPVQQEKKVLEILPWQTEDYDNVRQLVADFAKEQIKPQIPLMEKEGRVSAELIKQMADLGFFGIPFAEKYGGLGLGETGTAVMMEELCRIHASTAVMVGAHVGLGCLCIDLFGSEEQRERYLVPGIKGEKIGALATTEPDVGSDIAGIKTMAKKVDGGWLLNGEKVFITNGDLSDFVVTFAQTDQLGGNKTLAAFIVDSVNKGFTFGKPEHKIGLHASRTSGFKMDDVFVPEGNLLGEVGQGFKIVMRTFNRSRNMLAAACLGMIRAARDCALEFAKNRSTFGQPIYTHQLIQANIGDIEAMYYLLQPAVYQTTWMIDKGKDTRTEAAITKLMGSEYVFKAVDMALQIHGGSGYMEEYEIARLYRDSRVIRIFEGTSEILRLLIAGEVLKKYLA